MNYEEKKQTSTSSFFSKTKLVLWAVAILLTFLLGIYVTRWYYHVGETVESENATVLLEQVKEVAKLITVEGYFSEIYDYKDYYGYDLSMFRKKALMRVKAKVSIGYDLEKMKITSFPELKTVRITDIPPAEILSIDHDLDYYDVQEGMFNSFTTEDYNKLNANAKNYIKSKAQESDLFKSAKNQQERVFDMMRFMVESAGWKLEIEGMETPIKQDTLKG